MTAGSEEKVAKKCLDRTQRGCSNPDDEPGQDAPYKKDCKHDTPDQEPSAGSLPHGGKDLCVYDCIINAAYGFKKAETRDGQQNDKKVHGV
jgi:hypothetical protein